MKSHAFCVIENNGLVLLEERGEYLGLPHVPVPEEVGLETVLGLLIRKITVLLKPGKFVRQSQIEGLTFHGEPIVAIIVRLEEAKFEAPAAPLFNWHDPRDRTKRFDAFVQAYREGLS